MTRFEKIIQAAKSGGKVLLKHFGRDLKLKEKSSLADFQTEADRESEEAILKIIAKNFPYANVLSEERGHLDRKSKFTFVIDPLDGSNNFVLGLPVFSVNIALLEENKVIFSCVYEPILDRVYAAIRDGGAFLDNKKMKVSQKEEMKRAVVSYTCGYQGSREYYLRFLKKLFRKKVMRVFSTWAPALDLCHLASGKIEAVINNKNEIYDFLAGKLIAREAGALITDFQGKKEADDKNSVFLASGRLKIHEKLLKVLI